MPHRTHLNSQRAGASPWLGTALPPGSHGRRVSNLIDAVCTPAGAMEAAG